MNKIAMIAQLVITVLRKPFSQLNVSVPLIVLKSQNTSRLVKEDTIATMKIISSRPFVP